MTQRHTVYDDRHNETYHPFDNTQIGCDGQCVTCTPGNCPQWTESALVCPACLEFRERAYPLPKFAEHKLLVHEDGRLVCPECGEQYKDTADLAVRAIDNLKDALDNAAWVQEQAAA